MSDKPARDCENELRREYVNAVQGLLDAAHALALRHSPGSDKSTCRTCQFMIPDPPDVTVASVRCSWRKYFGESVERQLPISCGLHSFTVPPDSEGCPRHTVYQPTDPTISVEEK